MKTIFFLLAISGVISCNNGNDQPPKGTETVVHEKEESGTALSLNNGAKWKADSTTLVNEKRLSSIIENAKSATLSDYRQTATDLEAGLNTMISECRMQGADHEALHHWLEPLVANTAKLKAASNKDEAAAIFSEIQKQMALFPQYFE
jgi:hypothetical protein